MNWSLELCPGLKACSFWGVPEVLGGFYSVGSRLSKAKGLIPKGSMYPYSRY